MTKPLVLLQPAPQRRDRIFTPAAYARLLDRFDVVDYEARPDDADFARRLPSAFAVVGQPDLDTASLQTAASLKAIINVEGNFFPNVDYDACLVGGSSPVKTMPQRSPTGYGSSAAEPPMHKPSPNTPWPLPSMPPVGSPAKTATHGPAPTPSCLPPPQTPSCCVVPPWV